MNDRRHRCAVKPGRKSAIHNARLSETWKYPRLWESNSVCRPLEGDGRTSA
jgi:hypothetical protein